MRAGFLGQCLHIPVRRTCHGLVKILSEPNLFPLTAYPLELTVYPLLHSSPAPTNLSNGLEAFKPYSSKFWKIPEGNSSGKSFKRLHRYKYSPTAWYGNNEVHLHPWEPRRLSVREALRIQTVPDTYVLPEQFPFKL